MITAEPWYRRAQEREAAFARTVAWEVVIGARDASGDVWRHALRIVLDLPDGGILARGAPPRGKRTRPEREDGDEDEVA